jgi:hypothetical protein
MDYNVMIDGKSLNLVLPADSFNTFVIN